jgi:enoyl-CoA hydratase
VKEAVNQSVDNMGFQNALNACFSLHQINHSHWAEVHENRWPIALEEDGVPNWKTAPPIVHTERSTVRAEK